MGFTAGAAHVEELAILSELAVAVEFVKLNTDRLLLSSSPPAHRRVP